MLSALQIPGLGLAFSNYHLNWRSMYVPSLYQTFNSCFVDFSNDYNGRDATLLFSWQQQIRRSWYLITFLIIVNCYPDL